MFAQQRAYPHGDPPGRTFSVERRKLMRCWGRQVIVTHGLPGPPNGGGMINTRSTSQGAMLVTDEGSSKTRPFPDINTRTTRVRSSTILAGRTAGTMG